LKRGANKPNYEKKSTAGSKWSGNFKRWNSDESMSNAAVMNSGAVMRIWRGAVMRRL
jgi:hypothetical protein